MNRYEAKFSMNCPNDDEDIAYTLIIESDSMLMVERINGIIEHASPRDFHEELATYFHGELGGSQRLTATHQGVIITTVRQ